MLSEGMSSNKEETFAATQEKPLQKELTPEIVHSMQTTIPPFMGLVHIVDSTTISN